MKRMTRQLREIANSQQVRSGELEQPTLSIGAENAEGKWTWGKLRWLIPSLPLFVASARVVAASRGNATTLAALTSTLDVQALLSNTIAQMLPLTGGCIVVPWVYITFQNTRKRKRAEPQEKPPSKALSTLHDSMNGILAWLELAVIFLSNPIGLVFGFMSAYNSRKVLRDMGVMPFIPLLRVAAIFSIDYILMSIVVSFIQLGAIWLPQQSIHEPGKTPYTGYVLSVDDGGLVILKGNGAVESVSQNTSHQYCGDGLLREIPGAPILTYALGKVPVESIACPRSQG